MKATFFIFLFCLFFGFAHGQEKRTIAIGHVDQITSKILNEQREVWIHVPDDFNDGVYSKKHYPVVYLLDGDAHFYSVVGMIQQLSAVNGNTICPKMIVVGIPNTNRSRDLTPTKGKIDRYVDSVMVSNSGGGDQFISFIEEELIPYVDSNYPTTPYRLLIGHSLGGLTVMNTLVEKPELFNAYISIDPSMWWDNKQLLNKIKKTTFDKAYTSKTLYLAIANTMTEEMDVEKVMSDTSFATNHIRSILELDRHLSNTTGDNLTYKGKYYPDDDHGSVPFVSEYDALRFIFEFYQSKINFRDYSDPESDIIEKVMEHYARLSENFGYKINPDEEYINGLGYQFLSMQQYDKSEQFFKLNVTNYPQSFNVYDSLGDFYLAIGNRKKAREYFRKSVQINPESYSKIKLETLDENSTDEAILRDN